MSDNGTRAPRRPSVILTCKVCGVAYRTKASRAATSKYCGWPCKWKSVGESLIVPCATCGQDFTLKTSRYRRGERSCGQACKAAARTRSCDQCGVLYKARRRGDVQTGTARYCSRACANAALKIPFPDYVWAKVDQSGGPLMCWPWTGARDKDGYGVTHVGKRYAKAHRIVLEQKIGRLLKPGMMACHDCPGGTDHPWCCNPAHLWEGTARENRLDAIAKHQARIRHQAAPAR